MSHRRQAGLAWIALAGFLSTVAAFALSLGTVVPAVWGLLSLFAIPLWCVLLFVGRVAGLSPQAMRPSVMQIFGMGGRT